MGNQLADHACGATAVAGLGIRDTGSVRGRGGLELEAPLVLAEAPSISCWNGHARVDVRTWHGSASARVREDAYGLACAEDDLGLHATWAFGHGCHVGFDRVSVHGRVGAMTAWWCNVECRAYDILFAGVPEEPRAWDDRRTGAVVGAIQVAWDAG